MIHLIIFCVVGIGINWFLLFKGDPEFAIMVFVFTFAAMVSFVPFLIPIVRGSQFVYDKIKVKE